MRCKGRQDDFHPEQWHSLRGCVPYVERPEKVLESIADLNPAELFQAFSSPTVAAGGRSASVFASNHVAEMPMSS
jgi:hypothetical protein